MENECKEVVKLVLVLGILLPFIYMLIQGIKDEIKQEESYRKFIMCLDDENEKSQLCKLRKKYKEDDEKSFSLDFSGWLIITIVCSWFCVYLITIYLN